MPIVGAKGEHDDDWESVQVRINPDGSVDERASSHDGYNYERGVANWGSDAGIDFLAELAEDVGARNPDGWGPETGLLLVSGGSHAGNVGDEDRGTRYTPGRRVHLDPARADRPRLPRHLHHRPAVAEGSLARPRVRAAPGDKPS